MGAVIKAARVAASAIPLRAHQRPQHVAKSTRNSAGSPAERTVQDGATAGTTTMVAPALPSVPSSTSRTTAHTEPTNATSGEVTSRDAGDVQHRTDDQHGRRIEDRPAPTASASYDEAYADGHAEGSRDAYGKGHEEGLAAGLEQGRRETVAAADARERQARLLADAIATASARWERELEAGAIEIAYAAVLRILGQAAGSRDAIVAMVRKVMEGMTERRALSIHLSRSDHAVLSADTTAPIMSGVALVPDDRVEIGGCIVETDAGSLDARLETQLAGLRDLLLSLHRASGEQE